mgnify:CR=1 FL=1
MLVYDNENNCLGDYPIEPGADLSHASMSGAQLQGANLAGADLRGAYLKGTNLDGANLEGAKLLDAKMWNASLRSANLRGTSLLWVDLAGADLTGADLTDVNFGNSSLTGVNLTNAKLSTVIPVVDNLDQRMAEVVESLEMARWHTCETSHCRAGWAIHFAGKAGYDLEHAIGSSAAGALIYHASAGYVPDFYAGSHTARLDVLKRAKGVK